MLSIKNLESGYGKMQVLFGISLDAKPGDIAVLIGPNGAGKSTLLKSIFNLIDVYKGSIVFKNKNITKIPTHELIELGISDNVIVLNEGRVLREGKPKEIIKDKKVLEAYLGK